MINLRDRNSRGAKGEQMVYISGKEYMTCERGDKKRNWIKEKEIVRIKETQREIRLMMRGSDVEIRDGGETKG